MNEIGVANNEGDNIFNIPLVGQNEDLPQKDLLVDENGSDPPATATFDFTSVPN